MIMLLFMRSDLLIYAPLLVLLAFSSHFGFHAIIGAFR